MLDAPGSFDTSQKKYCIDDDKKLTCINSAKALKSIYPNSIKTKDGWTTSAKERLVEPYFTLEFSKHYGDDNKKFLLFVFKEFKTKQETCHSCYPLMHLLLFESQTKDWILTSSALNINGIGGWGELIIEPENFKIYNSGNDNFIFTINTSFVNQGRTVDRLRLFANHTHDGNKSSKILEIGNFGLGTIGCPDLPNEKNSISQIVFDFQPTGYPLIHYFITEFEGCKDAKPAKTLPQAIYKFNPEKGTYKPYDPSGK